MLRMHALSLGEGTYCGARVCKVLRESARHGGAQRRVRCRVRCQASPCAVVQAERGVHGVFVRVAVKTRDEANVGLVLNVLGIMVWRGF
jgi:hypothetical protein